MKKRYAMLASLVVLVGVVFANAVNSAAWFNQPKAPSMLNK